MNFIKLHVALIVLLLQYEFCNVNASQNFNKELSRKKRFLIWQPGINWIQMVGGIGLPFSVQGNSVTIGAVVKSYYLLATNSSSYTRPFASFERKKRSTSRYELYDIVAKVIDNMGFKNGRSCVLKTICEAAMIPFDTRAGLLSEILHVLLTPSSTNELVESNSDFEYHAAEKLGTEEQDCQAVFPDCDTSFMVQFTKVLSHL